MCGKFRALASIEFETAITLCAEEVCPAYLGSVKRLHWGFPDPAGPSLPDHEKLKRFREVRDGIQKKLEALIHDPL